MPRVHDVGLHRPLFMDSERLAGLSPWIGAGLGIQGETCALFPCRQVAGAVIFCRLGKLILQRASDFAASESRELDGRRRETLKLAPF